MGVEAVELEDWTCQTFGPVDRRRNKPKNQRLPRQVRTKNGRLWEVAYNLKKTDLSSFILIAFCNPKICKLVGISFPTQIGPRHRRGCSAPHPWPGNTSRAPHAPRRWPWKAQWRGALGWPLGFVATPAFLTSIYTKKNSRFASSCMLSLSCHFAQLVPQNPLSKGRYHYSVASSVSASAREEIIT